MEAETTPPTAELPTRVWISTAHPPVDGACDRCGAPADHATVFCATCGLRLAAGQLGAEPQARELDQAWRARNPQAHNAWSQQETLKQANAHAQLQAQAPEPDIHLPQEKTCPECAEQIKYAANVCRFCGHRFDTPARGPANPPAPVTAAAARENTLAITLTAIGCLALAVAPFLPLAETPAGFNRIENNTLVQHGGWALIILAVGIAVSIVRTIERHRRRTAPVILCLIAALIIAGIAANRSLRTLYPVLPGGGVDTSLPGTVAAAGIAIYVAGAGAVIAFIGVLAAKPSRS